MRIAIVGGGISGLGAAYVLAGARKVEVFEREPRAGGQANTLSRHGLGLDTGFLVQRFCEAAFRTRVLRDVQMTLWRPCE